MHKILYFVQKLLGGHTDGQYGDLINLTLLFLRISLQKLNPYRYEITGEDISVTLMLTPWNIRKFPTQFYLPPLKKHFY
jgi:hypothetical protein